MGAARLEDRKLAIWGFGREGRAALEVLRKLFPGKPLTVIIPSDGIDEARRSADWPDVEFLPDTDLEAALKRFDVVVKSPGISPYRPEVAAARAHGVELLSGTRLWFEEHADDRTVCITGTKGKSTAATLLAHLLRSLGIDVQLAGNIGTPLLQLFRPEEPPQLWVVELSSYQTFDFDAAPEVAALLNLFPEHLDWHKTLENYYRDKLRIFGRADVGTAVLNRADPDTMKHLSLVQCPVTFFNEPGGVHFEHGHVWDGHTRLCRASDFPLPGEHNLSNLCAVLTILKVLNLDLHTALDGLASFEGLPHRLQRVAVRNGVSYVDDSISTTPQSALAAIESFRSKPICILVGGYDRGLDWRAFADFVVRKNIFAVITMPQNGPRIAEHVRARERAAGRQENSRVHCVRDLEEAVSRAATITPTGGVVLLSPGAPSFGVFQNYEERGKAFADLVSALPESQ